ncbi:hypothetical protein SAMN04489761_3379 [Tenacibaculum sp. MAR_2009_124]|uniref:hypothetical protein n=1 Tax=Tenacibaculum sp. MAR_2009_124 TaxID=1250059 RepID=UPI000894636C|nr:hypothetical protein [Tenacibaculum sp. MAR_2009_124]SEC64392.1 hypothetical protein SAMN04489761_3379 [Tenacibaculum sp. MAR_2009_124]
MKPITHTELVELGYKWCLKRCGVAFKELKTTNKEIPDVIGFRSCNYTFLLEAKVSRSDFMVDKKKSFREQPEKGMGDFRFYITPKGLLTKEELPFKWGLIEVDSYNRMKTVYNPFGTGNIYSRWNKNEKNTEAESRIMYSVLRRLQEQKVIDTIYS